MKRAIAIITASIAASISSFSPAIASTQQTSQYVLESARRNGVNMGGWDANLLAYGSKVFCEGMDLGRQTPERYTASMAQRMAADGTNPRKEAAFGEWLAESVMLGSVLYTCPQHTVAVTDYILERNHAEYHWVPEAERFAR